MLVTASVVYYFVFSLPKYNQEKLKIELDKQEATKKIENDQLELEKSKVEIQNREVKIKESIQETKQNTMSAHQLEINKCEDSKLKFIELAKINAGCNSGWSCIISSRDTQNIMIISDECNRLRQEYGL